MTITQIDNKQICNVWDRAVEGDAVLHMHGYCKEPVLTQSNNLNEPNNPGRLSARRITHKMARVVIIRLRELLEDMHANKLDGRFLVGRVRKQHHDRRVRAFPIALLVVAAHLTAADVDADLDPGELAVANCVLEEVDHFLVDTPQVAVGCAAVAELERRDEELHELAVEHLALLFAWCQVAEASLEEVVFIGCLTSMGDR